MNKDIIIILIITNAIEGGFTNCLKYICNIYACILDGSTDKRRSVMGKAPEEHLDPIGIY